MIDVRECVSERKGVREMSVRWLMTCVWIESKLLPLARLVIPLTALVTSAIRGVVRVSDVCLGLEENGPDIVDESVLSAVWS